MMYKKNRGVSPGSGKTQCSSIGQNQNREVGRGRWKNRGTEEGLWDFQGVGSQKRGNHLKCKLKNISSKNNTFILQIKFNIPNS